MGKTGIKIGATAQAVKKIRRAIMGILEAPCSEDTKREALKVFASAFPINNVMVSSNVVNMSETTEQYVPEERIAVAPVDENTEAEDEN